MAERNGLVGKVSIGIAAITVVAVIFGYVYTVSEASAATRVQSAVNTESNRQQDIHLAETQNQLREIRSLLGRQAEELVDLNVKMARALTLMEGRGRGD